jgi:hypothetical protein
MTDRTIIPMPGNRAPRRGSHIPDPAAAFAGDLEARLRSDAPDLYAGLTDRRLTFAETVREAFEDRLFCAVVGYVGGCLMTVLLAFVAGACL